MKKLFWVTLLATFISAESYAWDNICNVAGSYVRGTTAQINELAERTLANRTVEGSGRVRDVKSGGLASKFTAIVDCGNDVIVEVPTNSSNVSQNLQVGSPVSFSGIFNGISRKRYVNTHEHYLHVYLNDYSSVW